MKLTLHHKGDARHIAASIQPVFESRPDELTVALSEDAFIYPDGAAWLATLLLELQRRGSAITFDGTAAPHVASYLARMNFFDHLGLQPPETGERHAAGGRFLPLMPIHGYDQQTNAVNSVLDLLLMHFDNAREIVPAVEWAVNEVIDNVLIHSEAQVPAMVFAQFYPRKHSLSVAICDAGRGLSASLREGHQVDNDTHALELAMERGITSGKGQGNGLAGSRQILGVNGGGFAIWSGTAFHYEDPERDYVEEIPPLPGTGVTLRFVTNRPIDLRQTFIESAAYSYIEALADNLSDDESLRIAEQCSGFGSRVPAHRIRRKILALLPDMDGPLQLDFAGVETVSSSFADELLGKMIEELGFDAYKEKIRVVNMEESVARRANVTIEQRMRDTMDEESFTIEFDTLRIAPEYEMEAWLAYRPEFLERDPDEYIPEFAERWDIELTDESRAEMLEAFERVKKEEAQGMKVIQVGSRVRSQVLITEDDEDPDPTAEPAEPGWVHAHPGDLGDVVEVRAFPGEGEHDGAVGITVQFDRSGTMTMCLPEELEPV